jgi:hypothetical protein
MEVFQKLGQRLKRMWLLDPSRLDAFQAARAYRFPAPASQPAPRIPIREANRKYDIKYFARDSRRYQSAPVALSQAQLAQEAEVGPVAVGKIMTWKDPQPGSGWT